MIFVIIILFIILITIWLLWEPYCFEIINLELKYKNLPFDFNDYSILFLSDIHTSKWGYYEKKLCVKLQEVKNSDICILGGDLAYRKEVASNMVKILNSANINGEVYTVFGNTEYKPHNDPNELEKIYKEFGFKVLRNENILLEKGNSFISLIGSDDPIDFMDDMAKAYENVPLESFKILVSHCPSVAIDSLDYNTNLVLAGHTHGGQVKLPFFNVYTHMNKNKFLNRGIWSSKRLGKALKRKIENFNLVVSNGLGTSQLWIRMFARPQIFRIVLKKD